MVVALSWVTVRGGPGTWVRNADWDEYILDITNISDTPIRLTSAVIFDSLDTPAETSARRPELIKASRKTAKRYKEHRLKVRAGISGPAIAETGTVVWIGGAYAAASAITPWGGVAAGGAATAAAAAVVIAPVLIFQGAARHVDEREVTMQILQRQSKLPRILRPGEQQTLHFFFPLAPSPNRLEIGYRHASVDHVVSIDTSEILHGLHIGLPEDHPRLMGTSE